MDNLSRQLGFLRNIRVLIVLALIAAFLATTTYTVMSESSVHGLTAKIFYVDLYCAVNQATSAKTVTFYIVASVWSSASLRTSMTNVVFSLSADGTGLGTSPAQGKSWDPGQGASYTLTFSDSSLSPLALPKASVLILAVSAQVTAGIVSVQVTASDTSSQSFGNTTC